jgi:hypothetical protein
MSALSKLALLSTASFYLVVAYFNVFAQGPFLDLLGLDSEMNTNGVSVMSMRCLGVAFFILSFIIGHMVKLEDKHGPALRTSTMTTALFAAVYFHRAFLDTSVSAQGAAACRMFTWANSALLVVSVLALTTLPKPAEAKRD